MKLLPSAFVFLRVRRPRAVLAQEMPVEQRVADLLAARIERERVVRHARDFFEDVGGLHGGAHRRPQTKLAWLATSTAGISIGSRSANRRTIARPVFFSYSDAISSSVSVSVKGTAPRK